MSFMVKSSQSLCPKAICNLFVISILLSFFAPTDATAQSHTVTPPSTTDWDIPSSAQNGDNVNIKYSGNKYVKSVKVVPLPTSVTIKTTDCLTMMVGETLSLQAEIFPDITGVDKTVTWSVSSGNAVTIDADGKVTAVSEGDATVTVTTNTNNKTDALTITVKAQANYFVAKTFTVGYGKKVYFSKGNLQYQPSSNTWRFAELQYTLLDDNTYTHTSTIHYSPTSTDWIDLFGWGMWLDDITDKAKITTTSVNNRDYVPELNSEDEFAYNKRTIDGVVWKTLSYNEWVYLTNTRPNAANLYGVATVNGVNGLILLPDDWTDPNPCGKEFKCGVTGENRNYESVTQQQQYRFFYKTVNEYTAAQWTEMEASGAVFLPASCGREGTSVYLIGSFGTYWTSSANRDDRARGFYFNPDKVYIHNYSNRFNGRTVRLVRPL